MLNTEPLKGGLFIRWLWLIQWIARAMCRSQAGAVDWLLLCPTYGLLASQQPSTTYMKQTRGIAATKFGAHLL